MGFKIEAAAAYWNASSNSGLNGYNGSLSVLSPIGIFATVSGAKVDANDARDPIYYYADVGYQQKFFELGTTAIKLARSEEHTSELQSLMRTSYAVFCLKKKTKI